MSKADSYDTLLTGIENALQQSDTVLVEEYIQGREATCGVIDGFRGQKTYALPPVEIIPPAHKDFFDYDAKYSGGSQKICPGRFSRSEKHELQEIAKHIHEHLGLRHYSRADFILSPKRGMYLLEVNTLPELTAESSIQKSLTAVGAPFSQFLEHIIDLAAA